VTSRLFDEPCAFGDFEWEDARFEAAAAVAPGQDMPSWSPPARTLSRDLPRLRRMRRARSGHARLADVVLAAAVAIAVVGDVALLSARAAGDGGARSAAAVPQQQAGSSDSMSASSALVRFVEQRPLREGASGDAVRTLQTALNGAGFKVPPDGFFGEKTRAAVVAFQSKSGLPADGVVGPATARLLVGGGEAGDAQGDAGVARRGITAAVRAGRLSGHAGARYRGVLSQSLSQLDQLPVEKAAVLASVLHDVAVQAPAYEEPRALVLFTMLETNARFLRTSSLNADPADIEGAEGVVYRFVPGHGYQFHPLANFARLNGLVTAGRRGDAARLADALVARGVERSGALTWEYYFPFGGPSRWESGFAQAVAAQALARTAELVADRRRLAAARSAFRSLSPSLVLEVADGTWVREYSFSDGLILNAQLQTLVSLLDYARIVRDADAASFVERLDEATRALLPRFDTGCWSRYLLGGAKASGHYHEYHVSLLKLLAAKIGATVYHEAAARWGGYLDGSGCP
jgi:D-glucuronyl C5-epimerase C-terminus/Putative peptidoglycan binding domain